MLYLSETWNVKVLVVKDQLVFKILDILMTFYL